MLVHQTVNTIQPTIQPTIYPNYTNLTQQNPNHSPKPWAWADRTWALPGDLLWASAFLRRLNSLFSFSPRKRWGIIDDIYI